jgi:hypothetical protein
MELLQAIPSGGSVKAEGLGDGGCANHRQAALGDATQNLKKWDKPNEFGGATQAQAKHVLWP